MLIYHSIAISSCLFLCIAFWVWRRIWVLTIYIHALIHTEYIYIYNNQYTCIYLHIYPDWHKGITSLFREFYIRLPTSFSDKFTYLGSTVSLTETDINTRLAKAWTAFDRLSVIWKSDLTDKMKCSFFQVAVMSILLYGFTTWTLTKRMEKKLDSNNTRMLLAILNNSWRQHPTRQQLYDHIPPIMKTIKIRQTRHAGHCWRSRDEFISDVLLWTPSYERAKAGQPARSYIYCIAAYIYIYKYMLKHNQT